MIDIGGTTTNLAVYEEGDLQHVAVLPVGSVNITNDLAIGLKTDLDIAELVKLQYATAMPRERKERKDTVSVKTESGSHEFVVTDIDMIVDARLEEIFELVNKELKSIGRAAKLPGGAVLTGGGAQLASLADYARGALQLSARIGHSPEFAGVYDQVNAPAWSTALGLMLIDLEGTMVGAHTHGGGTQSRKSGLNFSSVGGKLTEIFGKFRS